MKKFFIGALCASVLGMGTLISCGGTAKNSDSKKDDKTEEVKSNKIDAQKFPASTNIRYIDLDSVMANYELAKKFQSEGQALMNRYQSEGQKRQSAMQTLASQVQQKGQNNQYATQQDYEKDMMRLQSMQQEGEKVLGQMQQSMEQTALNNQKILNDSLENYLEVYNRDKKYDAILFKAVGAYFNPALDITAEVIKGLNERYKADKK